MGSIDPNQFIITRKRKKYKFAMFANARNCFELDEWLAQNHLAQGSSLYKVDVVEIGAGTGQFVVELAIRYPEKVFAALDVKADRLQKGAYEALERGLDNIYFIRARADQIDRLFAPHSLQAIWLTFSDPFPRKRSAGRRLTHPTFLQQYASLLYAEPGLKQGGLCIKHDNPEFFRWSLEQLVAERWKIDGLSFDLHESSLSDDYKILTAYEQRWLGEGRITQFVRAQAPC